MAFGVATTDAHYVLAFPERVNEYQCPSLLRNRDIFLSIETLLAWINEKVEPEWRIFGCTEIDFTNSRYSIILIKCGVIRLYWQSQLVRESGRKGWRERHY
jgi:hypothetical protein